MRKMLTLSTFVALMASSALAQPGGDWYLWKQTATGKTTCNQSPVGPGWERVGGPFEDPDCKIPQK